MRLVRFLKLKAKELGLTTHGQCLQLFAEGAILTDTQVAEFGLGFTAPSMDNLHTLQHVTMPSSNYW